jgi:hypothetical protein
MPRGGKRPGAGRKKGYKEQGTLAKEAARELQRQMVTEHLRPLTEAHINNAIGIKHLMLRDPKTGKFERVKDEEGIDAALKNEGEAVWIYTKDPSVEAFKTLMDRALDKPVEQVVADIKGDITIKWQGE